MENVVEIAVQVQKDILALLDNLDRKDCQKQAKPRKDLRFQLAEEQGSSCIGWLEQRSLQH